MSSTGGGGGGGEGGMNIFCTSLLVAAKIKSKSFTADNQADKSFTTNKVDQKLVQIIIIMQHRCISFHSSKIVSYFALN